MGAGPSEVNTDPVIKSVVSLPFLDKDKEVDPLVSELDRVIVLYSTLGNNLILTDIAPSNLK
jgi:hypothetical protein